MHETKTDDPDLTPLLDTLWDIASSRAVAKRVASGSSLDRRAAAETPPGDPPEGHEKKAAPSDAAFMSDVHQPDPEPATCLPSL